MTDTQIRRRVEGWQRKLSPLGVSHWRIAECSIVDDPFGKPGSDGAAWVASNYDTVRMQFRREYVDQATEQELDETILHEWVHVAFRGLDEAMEAVQTWMPEATYQDYNDRLDHEREKLVERMARALYRIHTN